jgi:hypothetical protein
LLNSAELKYLLSRQDLQRKTKILAILIADGVKPKAVSEITALAETHGLREIKKWNVSQILGAASGMAVRLPDGWEVTDAGIQFVAEQGLLLPSPIKEHQTDLRKHAAAITSNNVKAFIEECILALEAGLLRSAVTLSWVGAISLLYEAVLLNHLADFNSELHKRNPKHKQIKSSDDLATIKEYDFLQIINAISIIGKNVKQELEQCLQLRNACAHPSSLLIGERKVSAHLEILILNVYQKFLI